MFSEYYITRASSAFDRVDHMIYRFLGIPPNRIGALRYFLLWLGSRKRDGREIKIK